MSHKYTQLEHSSIIDGWNTNVEYTPVKVESEHCIAGGLAKMFNMGTSELNGFPQAGVKDSIWVETETRKHNEIIAETIRLVKKVYGLEIADIKITSMQFHWHKEYQH
jgi:hypothetical protein